MPQTLDVITRFDELESDLDKEQRSALIDFLGLSITDPRALEVVELTIFLNNCSHHRIRPEDKQKPYQIVAEVAHAIADIIPTGPLERQEVRLLLVAERQVIKSKIEMYEGDKSGAGISKAEIACLYKPVEVALTDALDYF